MNDLAAIADILAQGGQPQREQIDREIALYERRLYWLRLLRDAMKGDAAPVSLPPQPVAKKPRARGVLTRILAAMNGSPLSVRAIAEEIDASDAAVRAALEAHGELFERRTLPEKGRGGMNKVVYVKRAEAQ